MREFAERFVRLPRTSPFGNVPFRCSRQPFTSLLFHEMDRGHWNTFLVSGPSQSGKTLSAFVIPTLRDVISLQLNTIIGFPAADMASDKWDTDFRPTFESSPLLEKYLPTTGPGSKGGRIRDRITLGNGLELKIMTKGGDDTAKAGFTSPRVYVTEAAAWSQSSDTSVEANPLRQLKARMKAFKRSDERRRLFVEGTLTTEEELPWSARGDDTDGRLVSSRSRILSPCPHCGDWISPGRMDLVGWQNAQSEDEAANEAHWLCPTCKEPIDNEQRKASVAECRLVHHGQSVNKHGQVVGEVPPTSTLWFHWTGWDNLLRDIADFAVAEWEASQVEEGTEEAENAEKELCQFDFSVPYRSKLVDHEPLKSTELRKRTGARPRNVLSASNQHVVIGADVGKWNFHWVALAFDGERFFIPAYGILPVVGSDSDVVQTALLHTLRQFRDEICNEGFATETGDGMTLPAAVGIDSGYLPDVIAAFVRESGPVRGNRYRSCHGRGASMMAAQRHSQPKKRTENKPLAGTEWYAEINHERRCLELTFNADYYKLLVHDRFRVAAGGANSIELFAADTKQTHNRFTAHIANEQMHETWEPGKGVVKKWCKNGENHFLDALAIASVMHDMVIRRRKAATVAAQPIIEGDSAGIRMPDGRPFLQF